MRTTLEITDRLARTCGAAVCALWLAWPYQAARAAESFGEMFGAGDLGAELRYRFEFVDQQGFAKHARASTLRGRANFKTSDWRGLGGFAEFDYVTDVIWDNYNAGSGNTPDKTGYPTVGDPTGGDLNQLYLQWQDSAVGTLLRGGRQRIVYDNGRFVGNSGWRQNEQTFDAVYFQQKRSALDLQFAFLWQVNRISGNDVPDGRHDNATALLNAGYGWNEVGKLSGYYYDIDDKDVAANSTRTYGARFAGNWAPGLGKFGYGLEYARQSAAHQNLVGYDAGYYRLDASLELDGVTPYFGVESLGGDAGKAGAAFRTPLASLHGFNGWADVFTATPDAGLVDYFLGARGKFGSWEWDATYHEFDAESGSQSFGSELDASLGRRFAEHYHVLFKAALFDGDASSPYVDISRLWVQLTGDF
jgi:hypothetical protein